ncbi:MAG: ribonuclease D, partial [Frankiaceae bacterium]|nr:ribonuclease D [Frankiaceae bacterium]
PEAVRRLAWTPPRPVDQESVAAALRASGARDWQITRAAAALAQALPEPVVVVDEPELPPEPVDRVTPPPFSG